MSSRWPAGLMCDADSNPAIQNDSKSCGGLRYSKMPDAKRIGLSGASCGTASAFKFSVTCVKSVTVLRAVVFGRHQILVTLEVHDAFPPGPLHLPVACGTRPASPQSDLLDGKLGRAIRVQKSICLLVSIRELCVTEPGERCERTHCSQQFRILPRELLHVFGAAVAPGGV